MPRKSDWSILSLDTLSLKSDYRLHFKLDSDAASTLVLLLYRVELIGTLMNHEIHEDATLDSNIVHLICLYCFSLPVLYLMLLIGHYSKTGCMVIGKIVPLVHGVGFTMAIMSFIHCLYTVVTATDSLIFFYYSLLPGSPWMSCEEFHDGECLGYEEMKDCQRTPVNQPCMTSNSPPIEVLSAYHYRKHVMMEIDFYEITDHKLSYFKVAFSAVACVILALVTDLNFKSGKASKVILVIHIIMQFFVLIVVSFLSTPAENYPKHSMKSGFLDVFQVQYDSFMNPNDWMHSFLFVVQSMNAVSVSTPLMGSYMPRKSQADLFALEVALILLFLYLLGEVLISSFMSAIAINMRVSKGSLYASFQDNLFVVIPQIFGMSQFSPKILTLLFYGYLFFTNIWRAQLILSSIYESFADMKPIIRIYRFYIRTFSCFLIFILCLPIYIEGFLDHCLYFIRFLELTYLAIIHAIVSTSILYIYGSQKICDDHHFIYGSQPVTFYRVMLLLIPIFFVISWSFLYVNMYRSQMMSFLFRSPLFMICYVISLIPQQLGMFYKVIYYLKRQNMIHLLRCEDDWGDPNPQVRKERIIYHPRKENKYFRRLDTCKHDCLRYNHILPLIVTEEAINHKLSFLLCKRNLFSKSQVGIGKLANEIDVKFS